MNTTPVAAAFVKAGPLCQGGRYLLGRVAPGFNSTVTACLASNSRIFGEDGDAEGTTAFLPGVSLDVGCVAGVFCCLAGNLIFREETALSEGIVQAEARFTRLMIGLDEAGSSGAGINSRLECWRPACLWGPV